MTDAPSPSVRHPRHTAASPGETGAETPEGHSLEGTTMDTIDSLMRASLLRVFGEGDPEARLAAMREIYSEDITFADAEGVVAGLAAVNAKAQAIRDGAPGFEFSEAGPVLAVQDLGHLAWDYGPVGQDAVVSGIDIALVEGDRIRSIHTIVTKVPPGS